MTDTPAKPALPTFTDQDAKTHSGRRAFFKAIGGSTFLIAASIAPAGCRRSDSCRRITDSDPTDPVGGRTVCDGD